MSSSGISTCSPLAWAAQRRAARFTAAQVTVAPATTSTSGGWASTMRSATMGAAIWPRKSDSDDASTCTASMASVEKSISTVRVLFMAGTVAL